ncbi:hypothetical protein F4823DRAFT_202922 [Ustulina deusta]|nr:hypothetical protein F4823DRAFT_202922 [Ustulina deusta]
MSPDTTIEPDSEGTSFEPHSSASSTHEHAGTRLNPIVLDGNGNSNDKTKKVQNMPRPRRRIPAKRRKMSSNSDDSTDIFIPPRAYKEILQHGSMACENSAPPDDTTAGLQPELSILESLKSEKGRMSAEMATLSVTLDAAKKSAAAHNTRFKQSERQRSKLGEEVKSSQLRIAEAMKTQELLLLDLMAQRQLMRAQDAALAQAKKAQKSARGLSSLARRDLGKARAERSEVDRELLEAKATISALRTEHDEFVASSRTESKSAEENSQSSLDSAQKAYGTLKLDRDRLREEKEELANEREELRRRITELESKERAAAEIIKTQIIEVALAKKEASKLAAVEASLQVAQQRIEEMEDHVGRCPMAQKSKEFWEDLCKQAQANKESNDRDIVRLKANLTAE